MHRCSGHSQGLYIWCTPVHAKNWLDMGAQLVVIGHTVPYQDCTRDSDRIFGYSSSIPTQRALAQSKVVEAEQGASRLGRDYDSNSGDSDLLCPASFALASRDRHHSATDPSNWPEQGPDARSIHCTTHANGTVRAAA